MSGSKDLRKEAFAMFQNGEKLSDIAKQLNVPAGTVRRWKHNDQWEAGEEANVRKTNASANAKSERKETVRRRRRVRVYRKEEQAVRKAPLTEKQRLFCLFYVHVLLEYV